MKKIFRKWFFAMPIILITALSTISCSKANDIELVNYFDNVVEIKILKNEKLFGYATGTIMNGFIISNEHIIPKYTNEEKVEFQYRTYKEDDFKTTKLIKFSKEDDLAIFDYDGNSKGFVFSEKYQIGQKIYTIGNPLGHGLGISSGIISTFNYSEGKKLIRIAGSIDEGNSGGPILNSKGELIGIVSFKIKDKIVPNKIINSFYFAVKIEEILLFLNI